SLFSGADATARGKGKQGLRGTVFGRRVFACVDRPAASPVPKYDSGPPWTSETRSGSAARRLERQYQRTSARPGFSQRTESGDQRAARRPLETSGSSAGTQQGEDRRLQGRRRAVEGRGRRRPLWKPRRPANALGQIGIYAEGTDGADPRHAART